MRIFLSSIAAAAAVATLSLFIVPGASIFLWLASFIVALLHATFFGLPMYLIVRAYDQAKWWVALICGFCIGATSAAVAGLLSDITDIVHLTSDGGVLGMVGGLFAWIVWANMEPQEAS